MKQTIFIILCIFLSISNLVHADNKEWKTGYIITNKNDTIHGLLAYRNGVSDWEKCIYKKTESDTIQFFTPSQIREYSYSEGMRYESIELSVKSKKKLYFAECLLKGQMSLYYLEINSFEPFKSYYAVNLSTGLIRSFPPLDNEASYLTNCRAKDRLKAILGNNSTLDKEITKRLFTKDNIINYFKIFNDINCSDNACVTYKETKKDRKVFLTPYTGCITTLSKLDCSSSSSMSVSVSPLIGVKLQINPNKNSDRVLLNIGLEAYTFSTTSLEDIAFIGDHKKVESIKAFDNDSKVVSLGIGGEYRKMEQKLKPSLEIGMNYNQLFRKVKLKELPQFKNQSNERYLGIYFSYGINIPCLKGEIPIKLIYSQNLLAQIEHYDSYMHLGLSVGYRFKIK